MRNFLIASCLVILIGSAANAQIRIHEDFENSAILDWTEYADKDASAIIKMGALHLDIHKEGYRINCTTELPVVPEYDFRLKAKLLIPKVSEDEYFGVLFDMDDNFNKLAFIFSEDSFEVRLYNRGRFVEEYGDFRRIKLKKGRNVEMEFELIRSGGSVIVQYNNIEIFRQKRPIHSPHFGFITNSKLSVEELILEQDYSGQEMQ